MIKYNLHVSPSQVAGEIELIFKVGMDIISKRVAQCSTLAFLSYIIWINDEYLNHRNPFEICYVITFRLLHCRMDF